MAIEVADKVVVVLDNGLQVQMLARSEVLLISARLHTIKTSRE